MSDPKIILGYMFLEPQVKELIISRIQNSIYSKV